MFARADGFAPYFGAFTSEAGKEFRLRMGSLLEAAASGLVVEGTGNPTQGGQVVTRFEERMEAARLFSSLAGGEVVTGADGRFRIAAGGTVWLGAPVGGGDAGAPEARPRGCLAPPSRRTVAEFRASIAHSPSVPRKPGQRACLHPSPRRTTPVLAALTTSRKCSGARR